MRPIQDKLELNNLWYELWKRNDHVALYTIGGTPEEEGVRFEVFKILIESYRTGCFEIIPSNSDKHLKKSRLKCFNDYESANNYYHKLTREAKRYNI